MPTKTRSLHPILAFYLLAFTLSWIGYLPLLFASQGILPPSRLWMAGLILPGAGPALAAWLATPIEDKPTALQRLRSSFTRPRSPSWWLTAALLPPALLLAANLISRWFPSTPNPASPPASGLPLLTLCIASILANPCEEIGWRGFALTRLQQKMNPLLAALLVGVLWAAWHIPLFVLSSSPMHTMPFWTWSAGCVAGSVVLAWLYNRTGQSLAIVTLFHISFNICGAVLGTRSELSLTSVKIAAALLVLSVSGASLALHRRSLGDAHP